MAMKTNSKFVPSIEIKNVLMYLKQIKKQKNNFGGQNQPSCGTVMSTFILQLHLHEFAHLELCHLDKCVLEFSIENIEDEADMYIENILKYIDEINEEINKLNLIKTC